MSTDDAAALATVLAMVAAAQQQQQQQQPEVNADCLEQLQQMGFTEAASRAALVACNNDLGAAVEWIGNQPEGWSPTDSGTPHEAAHADNTTESDAPMEPDGPQLTLEEKVAAAQALIAKKKRERAEAQKAAQKEAERKRREEGAKLVEAREALKKRQREAEYARRRKEKEDVRRERERLRAQLALDKAERLAARAKAEGKTVEELGGSTDLRSTIQKGAQANPRKRMEACALLLSAYKDGSGLKAAKTLRVLVNNVITKPDPKYRHINLGNAAFQSRVASKRGGLKFLLAAGFENDEADNALVIRGEPNDSLLRAGVSILDAAIAKLSR